MGNMSIEKLLTDLKNLPKEKTGEDFEQKLLEKIHLYESNKLIDSSESWFNFRRFFNPILAPAFTLIFVFGFIFYHIERNDFQNQTSNSEVIKATPVLAEEEKENVVPTTKIKTPKRKDIVITKVRLPLNLGPGVSLDEPTQNDPSYETISSDRMIEFPYTNKPIQIRIPPPSNIFEEDLEDIIIMGQIKDSIRLLNSRKR